MNRYAVLSDVNGNMEALDAVLGDIKSQGIEDLLFLGDAVGYGPNPLECVAQLRKRVRVYLSGRLESCMIGEKEAMLTASDRSMIEWTREVVRCSSDHWEWLCTRPSTYNAMGVLAVHGDPRGSEHKCILLENLRLDSSAVLPLFSMFTQILFVGDNHQPWICTEDRAVQTEKETDYMFDLSSTERAIVSVGSVGQPRDGDPRACYVIVSDEVIEWRRVVYDVGQTAEKIETTPPLNRAFAMRLREGL